MVVDTSRDTLPASPMVLGDDYNDTSPLFDEDEVLSVVYESELESKCYNPNFSIKFFNF